MGTFIQIHVDDSRMGPERATAVASLCPVDIFRLDEGRLVVRPDREDECTLCELCLDSAPAQAITIRKTYKEEQLISRGGEH